MRYYYGYRYASLSSTLAYHGRIFRLSVRIAIYLLCARGLGRKRSTHPPMPRCVTAAIGFHRSQHHFARVATEQGYIPSL